MVRVRICCHLACQLKTAANLRIGHLLLCNLSSPHLNDIAWLEILFLELWREKLYVSTGNMEGRGEKATGFGPTIPYQRGVSRPITTAWEGQHKPTVVVGGNLHFGCFKALISSSILLATPAGRLYGFSKRSFFIIRRKSCPETCSRWMIASHGQ